MTGATLLFRQIHPSWIQAGFATSQAFRPTPKDESKLSGYDGDRITVVAAFLHYTTVWKLSSAGATAVTIDECLQEGLPTTADPLPDCPEHAVIDFSGFSDKECIRKIKNLQAKASTRGWLHLASPLP